MTTVAQVPVDTSRWQHPDLAAERRRPFFDLEEMVNVLDGGPDETERRRNLWREVLNHPELRRTQRTDYMSHEDKYNYNLTRGLILMRYINEEGLDVTDMRQLLSQSMSNFLTPDGNPLAVHQVMFIHALMNMCSEEQQLRWMDGAQSGAILGTYAQTEMGHGTFVRGLRTTATYSAATRTFDLHTPDINAAKWWPGGLGSSSTHALVMAQLYTDGGGGTQPRGIHTFMVQLRHLDTHLPLPGITVGEIGPKLGLNTLNNGYLMFNHVKVPLEDMLMKDAQLSADGTYSKPQHSKLGYGTMVFTRVGIAMDTVESLRIACTIAARYSIVRRQGLPKPDGRETQIIDFQTQQLKLLPHVAQSYVLQAAGRRLWDDYHHVSGQVRDGLTHRLPELHADSCALKALVTADSSVAIESLRMACGGHGYMAAARFSSLYACATAGATYEGENTVLLLQTARYLVKRCSADVPPSADSFFDYLDRAVAPSIMTVTRPFDPCNLQCFLAAYRLVARGRVEEVVECLRRDQRTLDEPTAWNNSLVLLTEAALAHCRYYVLRAYCEWLETVQCTGPIRVVLKLLGRLYATYHMSLRHGDFVTYAGMTPSDTSKSRDAMLQLFSEVRPHLIALTDAFDYPDELICSTLGAWDGDVYNRMFRESSESPLNSGRVPDAMKAFKLQLRSKL